MWPEPPQLDRTLQRLWQRLARLAASLLVMVEQSGPATPPRWIRPSLLVAEALTRRLLMLEARDLGPLQPLPARTAPSTGNARAAGSALAPSRRGFQLTEPIASLRAGFWIEGQSKGRFGPRPQPRILEFLSSDSPNIAADRTDRSNKLAGRLHALLTVIDEPVAAARRMARRMAPRASKTGLIRKRSPLRAGPPPGSGSRQLAPWLAEALSMVSLELRLHPPPAPSERS